MARLILFGHSFGGLVTASFLASTANAPRACSLMLSSPFFETANPVSRAEQTAAIFASRFLPDCAISNRVSVSYLCHDASVLAERAQDPLIHDRISLRLYQQIIFWTRQSGHLASSLHLPTLILQAGEDRVVSAKASKHFFDNAAGSPKRYKEFPDTYHELIHEPIKQLVYDELTSWASGSYKNNQN